MSIGVKLVKSDHPHVQEYYSLRGWEEEAPDRDPRAVFALLYNGDEIIAGARFISNSGGHHAFYNEEKLGVSFDVLCQEKLGFGIGNLKTGETGGVVVKEKYRANPDVIETLYNLSARFHKKQKADVYFVAPTAPHDKFAESRFKSRGVAHARLAAVTVKEDETSSPETKHVFAVVLNEDLKQRIPSTPTRS